MTAATVDYLTALPWFAVSDPDEAVPIYQSVVRDFATPPEHHDTPRDKRGRFVKADQ